MNLTGVLLATLFVVIGSAQDVYLASYFQAFNPLPTIMYAFAIAMLLFWLALGKNFPHSLQRVWKNKRLFGLLNLYTTLNWITFFCALKFIEPVLAGAIAFSLLPAVSVTLNSYFRPQNKITFWEKISSVGVTCSIALLMYGELGQETLLNQYSKTERVMGIFLCILTSVGMANNSFITKKLHEKKYSSIEVMAFRFVGLVATSTALIFVYRLPLHILDSKFLGIVIAIAFIGVIFPLFTIQKAMEILEPVRIALILSLTPGVTFVFEFFEGRIEPKWTSAIGALFCCVFAVLGVLSQRKCTNSISG